MKVTRGWRARALVQEASRNALSWRSRQVVGLAVAIAIGLAIAAVALLDFRGLTSTLSELHSHGRNLIVVQSSNPQEPASISVARCDQLNSLPGVNRAGAVVPMGSANFTQLGPHVPIMGVSPSLLPELFRVDAVVGAGLALHNEDLTLVMEGKPKRAIVGAPQADAFGTNSAVAVALPPTTSASAQCLVELRPYESVTQDTPLVLAALRSTGGPIIAVPQLKESYNVLDAYRGRLDRWLPLGAGALCALVALTLLMMRSSELAAYRLSGTSFVDLVRLLVLEQTLLAGTLVLFASFGLAVDRLMTPALPSAVFLWPWLAGLSWLVIFCAAAPFAARRSPAQLARDR